MDDPELRDVLVAELTNPGPDRIWYIGDAFRAGMSVDEVYQYSGVDPWFLVQIEEIVKIELEPAFPPSRKWSSRTRLDFPTPFRVSVSVA